MFGNPLPWKKTDLTPNLGGIDETDDMRPGLGWKALQNLQNFVRRGGLLITANDTSNFAVTFGFTPGVSIAPPQRLRVTGSVLRSKTGRRSQPDCLRLRRQPGDLLRQRPDLQPEQSQSAAEADDAAPERRRTSRQVAARSDDPDTPQNRPPVEIPEEPKAEIWEATPLTSEQLRNGIIRHSAVGAAPRRLALRRRARTAGLRTARSG